MNILAKIRKNRFTYQDIMEICPSMDYQELFILVEQWIADGKVAPIKKSGKTSFRPSIYHEYRKRKEKPDYLIYEPEIRALHPRLNISGYLKNPSIYIEDKPHLPVLSAFLWQHTNDDGAAGTMMSANEKSFLIWKDEKYLDSAAGRKLLNFNRITAADLSYYPTPEPFFTSICHRDYADLDVLVLENKDPWYSLTKVFGETGRCRIGGVDFGLLIYGEGNKVTRPEALESFLHDLTSEQSKVYYAGDLDIAGIDIFCRVMASNRRLAILPFLPFYQAMLRRAAGWKMNKTDDNRPLSYNPDFLQWFNKEEQQQLKEVLGAHARIPQEILTYQDYLVMSEGD